MDADKNVTAVFTQGPPWTLNVTARGRGGVRIDVPGDRFDMGARVSLTAVGRVRTRARVGGGSYLTASDPRLLFGLGPSTRVDAVEVRWPIGLVESFPIPPIDRYTTLREGAGSASPPKAR